LYRAEYVKKRLPGGREEWQWRIVSDHMDICQAVNEQVARETARLMNEARMLE
jgi:hypothetical protein